MLTNMKELLQQAKEANKAIFQLNINNLEWTRYILESAQKYESPIILGVTENAISYMGGYTTVVNLVVGLIIDLKITIPVVLHLDHGKTYESCKDAIDAGFTSVMIDGSNMKLEDNITLTSKVVEYANKYNVSVEGEVGILAENSYSTVEDCSLFAASTGIDALAPSVGNKHGIYKEKPNINFNLIKKISEETKMPLVLHGASGISTAELKEAIKSGICKININTVLQQEWAKGLKEHIKTNKDDYDPRILISSGRDNMVKCIMDIFREFNSN